MLVFSDGASFRLWALVKQYNVRMWEEETHKSHFEIKVTRENLCSDVGRQSLLAVSFNSESIVTWIVCVDMQQNWLIAHL
jgi:hypothetical protein